MTYNAGDDDDRDKDDDDLDKDNNESKDNLGYRTKGVHLQLSGCDLAELNRENANGRSFRMAIENAWISYTDDKVSSYIHVSFKPASR